MSTELNDIQEVFHYYDSRGDSRIAVQQVGTCLRTLGYSPTEDRIAGLTQQFDKEARLTIEEFIPLVKEVEKDRQKTPEELLTCLGNFDREGNGLVNTVELRYVLSSMGEKLSNEEIDILLLGQENADGKVNIQDFVRFITS
uniref:EF-hand domain-containing protein n=1 Tax=Acrobeloides nanus TaxID=290746 RepID=A0A914ECM3_9BILA